MAEAHARANDHETGVADPAQGRDAVMTIDVEEWFHVENLRRAVPRHTWRAQETRVEAAMDRMLERMAERGVTATCFILGSVAERYPGLVRRIADGGHEIASHGYDHELVPESGPTGFRSDVERSKDLLERVSGREVLGYRAPSFSLTDWALPILREVGYRYDSSFFPTTMKHSRYGKPESLQRHTGTIARDDDGFAEVCLSCLSLGSTALPWAGGGYFRLIPYRLFRRGVTRILDSGEPYVFYIHPWELDAGQPRLAGLKRSERFRHYLNIEKAEARWTSLLRDFRWSTIAELLARDGARRDSIPSMQGTARAPA